MSTRNASHPDPRTTPWNEVAPGWLDFAVVLASVVFVILFDLFTRKPRARASLPLKTAGEGPALGQGSAREEVLG